MANQLYVLIHEHRHGISIELFRTDKNVHELDLEMVCEKLGIDYEEDANESIDFVPIDSDMSKIPTL